MRGLVVVVALAACGRLGFDSLPGGAGGDATGDTLGDGPALACEARLGAGRSHFCVRTRLGQLECWGLGTLGQLGDGMSATHLVPTAVPFAQSFMYANGGRDETCSIAGGAVWCWGENGSGQLGNNSMTGSPTPVQTTGLASVNEVWPAAIHSCARASGQVYCWGDGSSGRLGRGDQTSSLVPVPSLVTDAVGMSAGGSHTCAIRSSGDLVCWGYNGSGQIGTGDTTDQWSPVQPVGISAVKAVSMRDLTTCAVQVVDGSVLCWGRNDFGQAGHGDFASPLLLPSHVVTASGTLLGARAIASGIQHECALVGTDVWCWGDNQYGQLGYPTSMTNSPFALQVPGLPPIAQLSLSGQTTCALDLMGSVHCLGYGANGELGNNTMTAAQPVPQTTLDACM